MDHIAQAERDVLGFERPINGVAEIIEHRVVGHADIARRVRVELAFGEGDITLARLEVELLVALPPDPAWGVDRFVLAERGLGADIFKLTRNSPRPSAVLPGAAQNLSTGTSR